MAEEKKGFKFYFKKVRGALFIFSFSTSLFIFLLFPLNDLGDLITAQVSKLSGNQVYLQFDDMSLSAFPPGLQMGNVHVETSQISAVKAQEITVLPSVLGLIKGKPEGSVSATGLLKGDVKISLSSAPNGSSGNPRSNINLTAQKVSLKEFRNLINLPFAFQGDLNVSAQTIADLSFQDQPEMDLTLVLSRFELPPTNVNTAFGPLTMPELKLKQVDLKGRLSNGTFIIEKGDVGQAGDEIQASIKGQMKMTLQNINGQIVPQLGSYNIDVDLKTQKSFQDKASLFLTFLQSHQKTPGSYKFKVASPAWGMPPQISTLR